MEKIERSVLDAGPFIHLHEIQKIEIITLFESIFTTVEILDECLKIIDILNTFKHLKKKDLEAKNKDFSKLLIEQYDLDLGEATGIALCKQEKIRLFFTDDLEAREIAKTLGFESHGTIAIILRAFREKLFSKNEVKKVLYDLYENSTLFMTKDLLNWAWKEVDLSKVN